MNEKGTEWHKKTNNDTLFETSENTHKKKGISSFHNVKNDIRTANVKLEN